MTHRARLTVRGLTLAGCLALSLPNASAQTILRVDAGLTTGAGDGSSWADAYRGSAGLHAALAAATPGDEIWIAEGLYLPSSTGDVGARFTLQTDQVALRGGFEGFESSPLERRFDAGVATVLSGDLLGNDDGTLASMLDNSERVLHVESAGVILEDLWVQAGGSEPNGVNLFVRTGIFPAGSRPPVVRRCRSDDGVGAGALIELDASAVSHQITDCQFEGNRGDGLVLSSQGLVGLRLMRCQTVANGGTGLLVFTAEASTYVENHLSAENGGPGVELRVGPCEFGRVMRVHQCTLAFNVGVGLAITNTASCAQNFITVAGVLAWGNDAGQDQLDLPAPSPSALIEISDCLLQGVPGHSGPDPQFRDPVNRDYSLSGSSPAIDRVETPDPLPGTPANQPRFAFDVAGQHRFFDVPGVGSGDRTLDIGAFEFTGSIGRHDGCDSTANSMGESGRLFARGSDEVASNSFSVRGDQLPPGQFAMLLASRELGALPTVGGPGTLCLGGAIGRFNQPGQVLPITSAGLFQLPVDLTRLPQPSSFVSAAPGESWRFQLWHRDVPGPSQFSGIVTVRFR